MIVRHIYNWLKEKDNKYTKSSGYTVQGGGYGGETVEPQRCIAPPVQGGGYGGEPTSMRAYFQA